MEGVVGESRQYVPEAWLRYELRVGDETALCNYNAAPDASADPTLCVIPTQAKPVVDDPARLKEKPNVMSQWIDRLSAAGMGILLMHGEHYDDLHLLAARAAAGDDRFARLQQRIGSVVDDALARAWVKPGRVVLLGSSRHGFAVMEALALFPAISAAVAFQPVVHMPRMSEFTGMDDNETLRRHDLACMVDRCPPRPLLMQTGYADERVGQEWIDSLSSAYAAAYEAQGARERFTHEVIDVPGHDGTRIPDANLDSIVPWLRQQGLIGPMASNR